MFKLFLRSKARLRNAQLSEMLAPETWPCIAVSGNLTASRRFDRLFKSELFNTQKTKKQLQ
ncbi:hypothetical protein [Chitinophaga flava]|uniref:Uncharacterized protein n=1 Tax=Chitinophaga flava TaxID=2259036 RepID=A0A365XUY0_9BACT|nr:hypothetical protein [Chitinophaga flava]RBL89928.1 hypothetical protein DF182_25985 [Chitinophaga flava]